MKYFLFGLFLLCGCAPTDLRELRYEGECEVKKLTMELRKLENQEEVQKASKRLKRHFNRIAHLLIETRKFQDATGEFEEMKGAEELFAELARLYEIPGVRALIEASQNEAVRLLDRKKKPL